MGKLLGGTILCLCLIGLSKKLSRTHSPELAPALQFPVVGLTSDTSQLAAGLFIKRVYYSKLEKEEIINCAVRGHCLFSIVIGY
jgi:hypothetical protein